MKPAVFLKNANFIPQLLYFVCIIPKQEMMDTLYKSYCMLFRNISTDFIRYFHDEIERDNKLIAILGPCGIGKITMLMQHTYLVV